MFLFYFVVFWFQFQFWFFGFSNKEVKFGLFVWESKFHYFNYFFSEMIFEGAWIARVVYFPLEFDFYFSDSFHKEVKLVISSRSLNSSISINSFRKWYFRERESPDLSILPLNFTWFRAFHRLSLLFDFFGFSVRFWSSEELFWVDN